MKDAPPPILKWHSYRVFALFIIALYSIRFGAIYTPIVTRPVKVPKALTLITAIVPSEGGFQPIWVLGFIWVILGLLALAAMVWMRLHNFVFIATAAYTSYWTLAYFISPLTGGEGSNGMTDVFAAVFLLVAVLFVTIIGLLTRPAARIDVPPVPHYDEETSIHHQLDPDTGGSGV